MRISAGKWRKKILRGAPQLRQPEPRVAPPSRDAAEKPAPRSDVGRGFIHLNPTMALQLLWKDHTNKTTMRINSGSSCDY